MIHYCVNCNTIIAEEDISFYKEYEGGAVFYYCEVCPKCDDDEVVDLDENLDEYIEAIAEKYTIDFYNEDTDEPMQIDLDDIGDYFLTVKDFDGVTLEIYAECMYAE